MIEFLDLPIHIRLYRSPPLSVRLSIALLASIVGLVLLAPIISRLWDRPQPIDTLVAIVLCRAPSNLSRGAFIGVVLAGGMLVGLTLEILVAAGERRTTEKVVLLNEVTRVDAIALGLVIAGVFLAGMLAFRTREEPLHAPTRMYRRWLLVSIVYPAVVLWLILLIYDILGFAGIM